MRPFLQCAAEECSAQFSITEVVYECPVCSGLLDVSYQGDPGNPTDLIGVWRERRMSNLGIDQSGVWRFRELLPFLEDAAHIVTLREGSTPLLEAPRAAAYAGLDRLAFKHQGANPTGSFKDNGMTAGVSQAVRLGMKRVACVSTGNTSASMAAYASFAGLQPVVFIPHGKIAYGKLSQALDYGAKTIQVEANFDQILLLVRELAQRLGIYLLNSVNPFRLEGQKTIVIELLDQRDWSCPDWIVLPGGNLGNVSALGKALRELKEWGFIRQTPKLAVIQAEGARPFYDFLRLGGEFTPNPHPETLATAIRIGDPVSWPKAKREICHSSGTVEFVSEQEIADAKAIIGRCGLGCEPASAATLAGIKKLRSAGVISAHDDVVGILTGNVLKDPEYIYRYHTGQLETAEGETLEPNFANRPVVAPNDASRIEELLTAG